MKKNRAMRAASALLVAVLMTTCTISGTFAKYVTEASSQDEARVAKWGVEVTATVDGAFATEYDADGSYTDYNGDPIAKTVVSSTSDKLVAPGTSGNLGATTIQGTPEVAVNVKKVADLTLTGWTITGDWNKDGDTTDPGETDAFYCPLIITVGTTPIDGKTFADAAAFAAAVKTAVEAGAGGTGKNYKANTPLDATDDVAVTWEWPFYDSDVNDMKDTALGNLATAPTIAFELTTTVTQID